MSHTLAGYLSTHTAPTRTASGAHGNSSSSAAKPSCALADAHPLSRAISSESVLQRTSAEGGPQPASTTMHTPPLKIRVRARIDISLPVRNRASRKLARAAEANAVLAYVRGRRSQDGKDSTATPVEVAPASLQRRGEAGAPAAARPTD